MLHYFWIAIICSIVYSQNLTNETQSSPAPAVETTIFFTKFPTLSPQTPAPSSQTDSPTAFPSKGPTVPPTGPPTITPPEAGKEQDILVTCFIGISGVTIQQVLNKLALWREIGCSALSAFLVGTFTCDIGKVTEYSITTTAAPVRRLLAEEGVEIEYLIVIEDPLTLNEFKQAVDSGGFANEFEEGLEDNFEGITVDKSRKVTYEQKLGDGDDFLGKEKETFGDKIASGYILVGVVCILVGTVWLLFLRSNIEYKYPTYFTQGQGNGTGQEVDNTEGPNAVEMQTIATAKSNSSE